MNFLEKIQNLPEAKRRIILWLVVVLIGLVLIFWWGKGFQEKIKNFDFNAAQKQFKTIKY